MYKRTYKCHSGNVVITYTAGNVPVSAHASDGTRVKNAYGISSEEIHECVGEIGGISVDENGCWIGLRNK